VTTRIIAIEGADDIVSFIGGERVRQGLSQRKLCADAGLSHGAYWFVKQSGGRIHLDTAMRLLNAVGADILIEQEQ